jgi:hypothetical protein
MAKLSTAASACASFCTEQDVAWLKEHPTFSLARRVRSAFSTVSPLTILPPRPWEVGKPASVTAHGLYLANELGFPVLYVKDGYKASVSDAPEYSLLGTGCDHVESPNRSYVLSRTKEKARGQVMKWSTSRMATTYSQILFDQMIVWLKEATKSQQVEAGKTIVISAKAQEYLIRLHCGSITQSVIPLTAAKEIEDAHSELLRTAAFTASAHDQAATMFGREKWLLWDMGSYVILAGVDTSSLCKVAQDIMSCKVSLDGAYYYNYEKDISLKYTHEPRAYRSFESMPDEVRASLMSSLAFVKTMLMQDTRVPASTTRYPGLLGLPFYYDHNVRSRISSVDGGWLFKCGNHRPDAPYYGQMMLMDKD